MWELCQSFPDKVEYLQQLQETPEIEIPPLEGPMEHVEDNSAETAETQSPAPLQETVRKVVSSGQSSPFTVYCRE